MRPLFCTGSQRAGGSAGASSRHLRLLLLLLLFGEGLSSPQAAQPLTVSLSLFLYGSSLLRTGAIGRPKAARGQASRFSCYMSLEHCCCIKVLQTTLPKRKRRIALAFLYCTLKSELIMKLKLRAPNRSSNDCAPEREVSGACKCLFMPASSKPLGLALSSLSPSSCNNGNNDNKLELNQAKFRSTLLLLLLLLVSVC